MNHNLLQYSVKGGVLLLPPPPEIAVSLGSLLGDSHRQF